MDSSEVELCYSGIRTQFSCRFRKRKDVIGSKFDRDCFESIVKFKKENPRFIPSSVKNGGYS
jgi:hypothetical protein